MQAFYVVPRSIQRDAWWLLAGAIGSALPSLRELVAKAETMPGGATVKPTLDAMLGYAPK